jgi:hypothetical protein
MAATGTAVYPSTSLFPGSSVYPGQGTSPMLVCLYSTDPASTFAPNWTDATADVRAFTTSRGRDNELSRVDPGIARITLNNRDRAYDPAHVGAIRPMNRWWIREQFAGSTNSIFLGYAHSYAQLWPERSGSVDAIAVVDCTDEFSRLAREKLPTTDPPRDTYADVVQFDEPHAYWRFNPPKTNPFVYEPTVGQGTFVAQFGAIAGELTPIIGDYSEGEDVVTPTIVTATAVETTGGLPMVNLSEYLETGTLGMGNIDPGNAAGLASWTVEVWFKSSEATPAAARGIVTGPVSAGVFTWNLQLETTGAITFYARNSGGTLYSSSTAAGALVANTWYHLVGVVSGSATTLYVNGVAQTPDTFTGSFGTMDTSEYTLIGADSAVGGTRYFDELAVWRTALSASRIEAHYNAGVNRGFPRQDPGVRVAAVLSTMSNTVPTSIRAGSREMVPTFMTGQDPLSELRKAEAADNIDAVLFIAKDGTITFLDDGHRSSSPWNTVQATFDDDGTDLPYQSLTLDYSTSYLANVVNVTRTGGTTSTVRDTASITAYGETPMPLTELPITTESDQSAIATALLAKYKDPLTRITNLDLLCVDDDLIDQVFRLLEIGSRIRVFRTPPGGGSRIDQTLFVQKIQVDGDPFSPWRVNLAVSPL